MDRMLYEPVKLFNLLPAHSGPHSMILTASQTICEYVTYLRGLKYTILLIAELIALIIDQDRPALS